MPVSSNADLSQTNSGARSKGALFHPMTLI